jgi:signal transduction histidine kinase
MTYRDLMLGRDVYIPSRADFKNAMLRSQLALISLLVGITYIFIDRYHDVKGSEPFYAITVIASFVTLILNRRRQYQLATYLFLLTSNFSIFYFSAIDPYESGIHMFFGVSCLMAFALLGYHNLKAAFVFILLSVILFLVSYWVAEDFITKRTFTDEYLRISFTTNFLVSLICCIAIIYFLMDVNHHSERQILQKNEALEKANAELDRFVYSASHDLKAPLSSLLGLIEIAKKDPEEVPRYLDMMEVRIHDLETFIKEIIAYSRNTRQEINPQNIDLRNSVEDVISTLMFTNLTANVVIENKISPDLRVRTDLTRLRVVLTNLISNSMKYSDHEKINPSIVIEAHQRGGETVITIKDNGIGIDNAHIDKIFNMFFRGSEKSKGSGLGLYIVKETLAKLNGSIRVESTLGEGSTFVVTLCN